MQLLSLTFVPVRLTNIILTFISVVVLRPYCIYVSITMDIASLCLIYMALLPTTNKNKQRKEFPVPILLVCVQFI